MNEKKAIIITGATKRLGLQFTKESLAQGYAVVAHYRSSKAALSSWLKKNPRYREDVFFIRRELAQDPEKLIHSAFELPLTIVGLINNAAIFTQGSLLDDKHFENMLYTNALLPLTLSRLFAQNISHGWIINVTDAHIAAYNKKYQNYRLSKRLLTEITNQLAALLAPHIRVNALAPGAMLPSSEGGGMPLRALKSSIPMKKTGDLASLLQAYRYLLHNDYITGQTLYVDGGWHLIG